MYTEDTIIGLIDSASDVGGLRLSVPFSSLTSVVGAFYQAGRECRRDPRVMLVPASFSAMIPPINIPAVPICARWLCSTPARPFLDRDRCSAPLAALSYFLAPL